MSKLPVITEGASKEDFFEEAIQHPGWIAAMQEELAAIHKNNTWGLVVLPLGKVPISSRWVYKVKPTADVDRLKARLVARGNEQIYGIDFNNTFAPMVKWATLRTVTAIAAALQWEIHHMDVVTAFLNGKVKEELYMLQLPGFLKSRSEDLVCRLNNSLYGLHQSPRAWYETIDTFLRNLGWKRSKLDHNMYDLREGKEVTIIIVYVDDLKIVGSNVINIAAIKEKLKHHFRMKDLGLIKRYLGVEYICTPEGITMRQRDYCIQVLKEFDLFDCKPTVSPLPEAV
ncbi:unnamed protein product [Calypogeia fissa]